MTDTPAPALTHALYDAFAHADLDRWDALVAPDVRINSPAGWGMQGRDTLKGWAAAFAAGLARRIDLVDEHLALDAQGNGRGFITFLLHWKHTADFFGLKPTGREGTSVESLILRVAQGRITHVEVADHTLDLALYLWERGWPSPHHVRPPVLREGPQRG